MAVCIFLICTLQAVLQAINTGLENSRPDRLVTRHRVSLVFTMPVAYEQRIEAVPGVKRVARSNWFGGMLGSPSKGTADFKNFFPNFAVDAEPYFAMYPEYIVAPARKQAFLQDLRGCIIGSELAQKFNWKVGDAFQLESIIPPYQRGGPFEFVVRGIYATDDVAHPGMSKQLMLFHYKYLYEKTQQRVGVGTFVVQVANPSQATAVASAIDTMFENSDVQTKTESERAFVAGFIAQAGNLVLLLNGIGLAVAFTVLLVTANTMSMAVRERRTEIAVLKTLGFSGARVLALVLGEALALGALGGVVGVALAGLLVANIAKLPFIGLALGGFSELHLSPALGAATFTMAALIGLGAGLMPAVGAYRANITSMLRQV
jgi:putative ABC transport system permease protein